MATIRKNTASAVVDFVVEDFVVGVVDFDECADWSVDDSDEDAAATAKGDAEDLAPAATAKAATAKGVAAAAAVGVAEDPAPAAAAKGDAHSGSSVEHCLDGRSPEYACNAAADIHTMLDDLVAVGEHQLIAEVQEVARLIAANNPIFDNAFRNGPRLDPGPSNSAAPFLALRY